MVQTQCSYLHPPHTQWWDSCQFLRIKIPTGKLENVFSIKLKIPKAEIEPQELLGKR
jgi:hypothetical protein